MNLDNRLTRPLANPSGPRHNTPMTPPARCPRIIHCPAIALRADPASATASSSPWCRFPIPWWPLLLLAFAWPGPCAVGAEEPTVVYETVPYTGTASSFATSKFPRALRAGGFTYFSFVQSDGTVLLGQRHVASDSMQHVPLGEVTVDDHSAPFVHVDADGIVFAWWYDRTGRQQIHQARSTAPHALEFQVTQIDSGRVDYPVAFEDGGLLYLIYRSDHDGGRWSYMTSDDRGDNWSVPALFFDGTAWPYLHTWQGADFGPIEFARGGQTFHSTDFGIYHLRLHNGVFSRADGTEIGPIDEVLPLNEEVMQLAKAPAGDTRQRVMEVVGHTDGPCILIAANITPATGPEANYTYERLRFDAGAGEWIVELVAESNHGGPGDLAQFPLYATLHSRDPDRAVASIYRPDKEQIDLALLRRVDDGAEPAWRHVSWLTDSVDDDLFPQAVRHADDEWIWHRGSYQGYTDFDTRLWGLRAWSIER